LLSYRHLEIFSSNSHSQSTFKFFKSNNQFYPSQIEQIPVSSYLTQFGIIIIFFSISALSFCSTFQQRLPKRISSFKHSHSPVYSLLLQESYTQIPEEVNLVPISHSIQAFPIYFTQYFMNFSAQHPLLL